MLSFERIEMKIFRSLPIVFRVLLALPIFTWILYFLFGNRIIAALYAGKTFGFLGGVINASAGHPLENYLSYGNYLITVATVWYLIGIFLLLGLYLMILRKYFGVMALNLVAAVAFYEIMLRLLIAHPGWIAKMPEQVHRHLRQMYEKVDLKILHLQEGCIRYDPDVTYTLNPGQFIFSSLEFKTKYYVNASGFRDDDESLHGPEIIVLGDSFAMGAGVEQDEAFPEIIERRTGLKVLNTGVVSYATVREMRLLKRLDTSNLKFLIVQYYENDLSENMYYLKHGDLKITDSKAYAQLLADSRRRYNKHNKIFRYTPYLFTEMFRGVNYLIQTANARWRNVGQGLEDNSSPTEVEVKAFLNALNNVDSIPDNVRVIVLTVDYPAKASKFNAELIRQKNLPQYCAAVRKLIVVDLAGKLHPEHSFVLDGHLNAKGHALVADEIIKSLDRPGRP